MIDEMQVKVTVVGAMKSGWKTTEFWIALLPNLVALCGCMAPRAVEVAPKADVQAAALAELKADVQAEFSPLREAVLGVANRVDKIGATVGEINARTVDASTNNWSELALLISIALPTVILGAILAKAIGVKTPFDAWVQRKREVRAKARE